MAKPPKKPKDEDIEVAPDAWERFEKTIDEITKTQKKSHEAKVRQRKSTTKGE